MDVQSHVIYIIDSYNEEYRHVGDKLFPFLPRLSSTFALLCKPQSVAREIAEPKTLTIPIQSAPLDFAYSNARNVSAVSARLTVEQCYEADLLRQGIMASVKSEISPRREILLVSP